ncbi:MAG: 4Fe-4S dicluster domain-containing protein [Candidatus Thorarchaeota archaeon]|nr:4Fe-4S dicluster domain-containing protein [Candidatus Thorarchaeota archaeon]
MNETVYTPTSSFAEELAAIPGGEAVNKCIQCGICTASCAVARYSDEYRPRQLIQKILLGEREEVLKSTLPWLCMTCRLCEERCQEGVSPAEIFHAVRILAAREGHVPQSFRHVVSALIRDGWLLNDSYTDFEEDDREDLGLNTELGWNNEFLKRIKKLIPLEESE